MTKVKSAIARGGAGIDAIEIVAAPMPSPGPGEALVRLKAATLNYRDILFATGRLPGLTKEPSYVPLSCATGEVLAIGDGVIRVKPGDRVSPTFFQNLAGGDVLSGDMLGGSADGVGRSHAVFPENSLCVIPDAIGDLDAATLPCAGITAWSALFGARPLQPGETVLVQGTGGVSIAALQWAKAAGATVVITSSSAAKLARAKALGADIGINYRTSADWATDARAALGGKGVDIIVDVVGTGELERSAGLLNEGGLIAAIGLLDGDFSWTADPGKRLVPISCGTRDQHEAMLAFMARHAIRPVIDIVYDLERLPEALRRMESGDFFGKIGINLL